MAKTEEYKDKRGKNRIRHTADNGRVTYASTQGYENKSDMRKTAVATAVELLATYPDAISTEQWIEISRIRKER